MLERNSDPIHCSDKKRLQFYVKDGDTWDRDPQNTKIDESITAVTNKAFNELRQMARCTSWLRYYKFTG